MSCTDRNIVIFIHETTYTVSVMIGVASSVIWPCDISMHIFIWQQLYV